MPEREREREREKEGNDGRVMSADLQSINRCAADNFLSVQCRKSQNAWRLSTRSLIASLLRYSLTGRPFEICFGLKNIYLRHCIFYLAGGQFFGREFYFPRVFVATFSPLKTFFCKFFAKQFLSKWYAFISRELISPTLLFL